MARVEVNDIHYHVAVAGSGPPLVLLHGFSGASENWQPHVAVFAEQFTAITIDLMGHGQSAAPAAPTRYRMQPAARDLIAIFDTLKLGPLNLLGYSMGGRLALYTAIVYPARVRALILESASPGLDDRAARRERVARDERLANQIEEHGIGAFVEYWSGLPLFASQLQLARPARERLRTQRLRNTRPGLANSLRGMGSGAQPSLWPRLAELDMPVLLLAGELDPKFVRLAERMKAALPNAQLSVIAAAGHTAHLEQPDLFNRRVLAFLA